MREKSFFGQHPDLELRFPDFTEESPGFESIAIFLQKVVTAVCPLELPLRVLELHPRGENVHRRHWIEVATFK
jgi:hypothetical protein